MIVSLPSSVTCRRRRPSQRSASRTPGPQRSCGCRPEAPCSSCWCRVDMVELVEQLELEVARRPVHLQREHRPVIRIQMAVGAKLIDIGRQRVAVHRIMNRAALRGQAERLQRRRRIRCKREIRPCRPRRNSPNPRPNPTQPPGPEGCPQASPCTSRRHCRRSGSCPMTAT